MNLGIPELTSTQIEDVCTLAEDAARKFIFSQLKQKQVRNLNISVEAEGTKPVNFTVEVDLELEPDAKAADQKKVADEAVKHAFETIENQLRKLK